MLNKPVTWLKFSPSPSSRLTPVLLKWLVTVVAVVAAVTVAVAVAVVASLPLTLLLLETIDDGKSRSTA